MNHRGNRKRFAGRLSGIGLLELAALAVGMLWFMPALPAQDAGQPTQDAGQPTQDAGQPARAVRLSYVDGKVTLSQNGQVLAEQAVANTPLLEGMTLTTADDGRAEIQFEDGSVARLAPDSALTLQVLSGQGASGDAEMALNHGLAYFELQDDPQIGPITVHFGDSAVTANGFTVLRVTMDHAPGSLAVFSGNAHLERGDGAMAVDVHGGESVALTPGDPSGYNLAESIQPNSWDAWNSDRDQALTNEASDQTQAPQDLGEDENNPAWNDLDANGAWYNVPDQGYVWSPYAAANAGFDPYANGDWMWTPGYGYIWASGYPWGYMPFQCGAWNFYGGFGWGWAPGFGGCQPWWMTGFYGGPNIGFAPPGYLPIRRPPRRPIGRMPRVIAVHRSPTVMTAGLPSRRGNAPAVIDGQRVQALRSLPSQLVSSHAFFGAGRGTVPVFTGGTVNRPTGQRSGFIAGGRPGYVPAPRSTSRPIYAAPRESPSRASPVFSNRSYQAPSQPRSGGGFSGRPAGQPSNAGGSHDAGGGGGFHGGGGSFHGGGGGGGGGAHGGGGGGRR